MSKFREPLSLDFTAAMVVGMLFVFVPVEAYVGYRSLYGEFAELKLFVFGALGMSAVFSLFAGQGRRVLALMPGLVAGLSGVALYLYLLAPALSAAREARPSGYLWFIVFLVGTTPGMLLYWLFRRLRGDDGAP